MNRGIQLKQLRASDLGHLGIPYHLLDNPLLDHPPTTIADATFVDDASDRTPPLAAFTDGGLPDPLTLTREVRRGLEQTLALLTQALPAECRPATRRDD